MKVKFLMAIAGGINAYKGDVKNVEDKEAQRLIKASICEPYDAEDVEDKEKRGKRPRINTR